MMVAPALVEYNHWIMWERATATTKARRASAVLRRMRCRCCTNEVLLSAIGHTREVPSWLMESD